MNQTLLAIAQHFSTETILSVHPYGDGHINETYLARDRKGPFILQRLNTSVFAQPHLIFENQLTLQSILTATPAHNTPFRIPHIRLTRQGHGYYQDESKQYWRAQEFIDQCQEVSRLQPTQATSVGRLLGRFHRLGIDLLEHQFHDTLPGLHATGNHLRTYHKTGDAPADAPLATLHFCRESISRHEQEAIDLDLALTELPKRFIHGDPKLANILFAKSTRQAVSLIDLDTIGPGYIHHDVADLIRSCCDPSAEDSPQDHSHFDLALATTIITGYSLEMAPFLSVTEKELLGPALWLIPFELGVRFLSDYLQGSIYFKTSSPHHNLVRAKNQFQLSKQIRRIQPALETHLHHSGL